MKTLVETSSGTTVHLFGGPYVSIDGARFSVPEGSKRLLAFVALRRQRVERRHAAGALWPVGNDDRAAGNLRSALWRLRGAGIEVLRSDKWSLSLRANVRVDVHQVDAWANRVISGDTEGGDLDPPDLEVNALDLLPGWYDDWTLLERERLRQRILHALEAQSRSLSLAGRHADAIETALAARKAEPLRESAQRVLIEAYLSEGNQIEAQRSLAGYASLLDRELGVAPSNDLVRLVRDATRNRRSAATPLKVVSNA